MHSWDLPLINLRDVNKMKINFNHCQYCRYKQNPDPPHSLFCQCNCKPNIFLLALELSAENQNKVNNFESKISMNRPLQICTSYAPSILPTTFTSSYSQCRWRPTYAHQQGSMMLVSIAQQGQGKNMFIRK